MGTGLNDAGTALVINSYSGSNLNTITVYAITNSGKIYGEAWNATNDYYFIATLQSETPEPATTIPTLVALGLFAGFFLYRRKDRTA